MMKYTLYRSHEELGSPHRAIGTFTIEDLQEMASREELHADSWIEEAGLFGGNHRVDEFGPLMEYSDKLIRAGEAPALANITRPKPDMLEVIRSKTRYRSTRDLIGFAAGLLLILTLLGMLVSVVLGLASENLGLVLTGIITGLVTCLLIVVFKRALMVLVDIADTLLQQQEAEGEPLPNKPADSTD